MNKRVRVLIVDDSALVREVLSSGLSGDPDIEVVGTATDPFNARDKIVKLRPDVMTLDVEMPKMDGVEFLRQLMPQFPLPVVMVSALTERGQRITLDALDAGAVDFVTKPRSNVAQGLQMMMVDLRYKVKVAARSNVSQWKGRKQVPPQKPRAGYLAASTNQVIVIGASTGGTEAIKDVITKLPATSPGVVIVQHMPAGFTKMFADRLNEICAMEVREASDGDAIIPGRILVAPGALQMQVVRSGGSYKVVCKPGEKVNGHCPSVEVLMNSARTLAQDEATCVVYGMPKVAWEMGAAEKQVPLGQITDVVLSWLSKKEELV